MTDLTNAEPIEEAEESFRTFIVRRYAAGVGEGEFDNPDGPRTEPVVFLDAELVEAGTDEVLNARIVLAGATSALVAEELDQAAHSLLGMILASAGLTEDDLHTHTDAPEGEKGADA